MMAMSGIPPSGVPWTMQPFGRAMLTDSRNQLILPHFASFYVYSAQFCHIETIKVILLQLNVFCVLITWPEWNSPCLIENFLSQTVSLTLKHFLKQVFLFYTLKHRQWKPWLCLRIWAIHINAAHKRHCMWVVEGLSVMLFNCWACCRFSIQSLIKIFNFILANFGDLWAHVAFKGVMKAAILRGNIYVDFFQSQEMTSITFFTISSELNAYFLINNRRPF